MPAKLAPITDPLAHVAVDPSSGCWNWQGKIRPNGYARWGRHYAHRVYFEIHKGPIPEGLAIDHLCKNIRCVNPEHLEAVTPHVNALRSDAPSAQNARKTHCAQGHEFTPENTIWRPRADRHPWRECRTCKAAWAGRSAARKAESTADRV